MRSAVVVSVVLLGACSEPRASVDAGPTDPFAGCDATHECTSITVSPPSDAGLAIDCIPRELPVGPDGLVPCRIYEALPPTGACASLPARTPVGAGADGEGELCEIRQVHPASSDAGWAYETSYDPSCDAVVPRIAYRDIELVVGSTLTLVCARD